MRPTLIPILLATTILGIGVTSPAHGEIVTHEVTGSISAVTGQPGATGLFAVGQSAVLRYNIERATSGTTEGARTTYLGAIRSLELVIDGVSTTMAPGTGSVTIVLDNFVAWEDSHLWFYVDQFEINVGEVSQGGPARFYGLRVFLEAFNGNALADSSIPMSLALSSFNSAAMNLQFRNRANEAPGWLEFRIDSVAVPAFLSTWGRIKSRYAR